MDQGERAVAVEREAPPFQPYVADDRRLAEFTPRAIVLGIVFGLIFGAATVYLALRAGLTVSASIPIAVLAIAVLKRAGSTILENNIVQTIGSAGESIAAGVVFTVPAFLFLAGGLEYFNYYQILTLAIVGGLLGVLFMVPLRRALIVKEHGVLPYPEGTACAEVLIAGERGGTMARRVFQGMGVATVYKVLNSIFGLWKEVPSVATRAGTVYPNAVLSSEITPEYLGVGYIVGPRIAGVIVSGSLLSWLVLIPLLSFFVPEARIVEDLRRLGYSDAWIQTREPATWLYNAYIRYIGAGAVAMAGLITLARTLPTIVTSFREGVRALRSASGAADGPRRRTERDLPMAWVLVGSLLLVLVIAFLPRIPHGPFPYNLVVGFCIVLFGFFFVTVSSRIVGIIGSSSNPISGMTIATLMATSLLFLALGMRGDPYQAVALIVGAIVCIAAANAGATSQDLKTGFLVGATPVYQQVGIMMGAVASSLIIGYTLIQMHHSAYGPIGSERLPAPQATLMATVIKGILSQNLPWGYIFIGAGLALVVALCGVSPLAWAVGAYLPLSTTMPIFIGGVMHWLVRQVLRVREEGEVSSGMLFSTGLVAGGSVTGILVAALFQVRQKLDLSPRFVEPLGKWADLVAVGAFGLLAAVLVAFARKPLLPPGEANR